MSESSKTVLHICNYAAPYRGNFINSITSLEVYQNVKNVFLFPCHARGSDAQKWIDELNTKGVCAYIQEESLIKKYFQLKKIIKKHRVDNIVRHFSDLRIDFIIKLLFDSKKVIRFFHCSYRPNNAIMHKLRCFLWNKNLMVGVSKFVSNELIQIMPGQKIVTVPNAIDFERFESLDSIDKSTKITLTMMGWDQKGKGVDLALKAVDRLASQYDIVLRIVVAKNIDAAERFVVETLGKRADWVTILPPTNNINKYYRTTDIFLSPSRAEAFGYSVIEAAYCGAAIVASKIDGQAELKVEGAYWFESENIDDFTEKLEKAIIEFNTPERIEERVRACNELKETYSLYEWSSRVVALL